MKKTDWLSKNTEDTKRLLSIALHSPHLDNIYVFHHRLDPINRF